MFDSIWANIGTALIGLWLFGYTIYGIWRKYVRCRMPSPAPGMGPPTDPMPSYPVPSSAPTPYYPPSQPDTPQDFWLAVGEKLGVPTLLALILYAAIWASVKWAATKIGEPIVNKHIEFLETEQKSMQSIARDVGRQTESIDRQTSILKEMRDDQRKFPAIAEKMP